MTACHLVLAVLISANMADMSPIKSDEQVIFFPTAARLKDDGQAWIIPIHGWIFEPEQDDVLRAWLVGQIEKWLPTETTDAERLLFEQRLRWFLVDNERGKNIGITLGDQRFVLEPSATDGHFFAELEVPAKVVDPLAQDGRLTFRAITKPGDGRVFQGTVHLLSATGVTVISDIDDTIKISEVTDKARVLQNTFMRPFAPVEGMAQAYQRWASAGATLHFVSMSPWQLYPALSEFETHCGFPAGTYHLQRFRVKDSSLMTIFSDPQTSKGTMIEEIISHYPQRHFVLVGDTGQKDPELYGQLASKHPDRVRRIPLGLMPASRACPARNGNSLTSRAICRATCRESNGKKKKRTPYPLSHLRQPGRRLTCRRTSFILVCCFRPQQSAA